MADEIQTIVPEPIEMATETIRRLNKEGRRSEFGPLNIVDECREALTLMPQGKSGLVVGSGPNTEAWKRKGWKTLDIDASSNADIIYDANFIADALPTQSLDFIFAEAIKMDPKGIEGVSPARLLNQANKVLKPGGKLIIKTAHIEGDSRNTLPDRSEYIRLLQDHGFHGIAELGPIHYFGEADSKLEQQVIYYGKKSRPGFDTGETITYSI